MEVESTYSISFFSDSLNEVKYNYLLKKAKLLREFKNSLSERVRENPLPIFGMSQFDFMKAFNCEIDGLVGREIQPAIADVYTKYQNKIGQFKNAQEFNLQDKIATTYYKKDTKRDKKGDVKSFGISYKKTQLTKVLGFLAKYYNETTVPYLIKEIGNKNTKKSKQQIELYKSVLFYIDKYGERLFRVVQVKRDILVQKIFSNPILFKELTYKAINSTGATIAENRNSKSKISHYITLTGFRDITMSGKMDIPVKYNKKYHGDICSFNKQQTSYTIQFVKDKIRVIMTKEGMRKYKEDCKHILGVDVNLKHNLFSCSNEKTIDFDRELIKNYVKTQLKFDKKSKMLYKTDEKELTPKQLKQKEKTIARKKRWDRKLNGHYNSKASELIKMAKEDNCDHLSVEDLLLSDKGFYLSEEFCGLKYSRLVRILHLSNFKNILANQCHSKNMQLTIVPSHYTSQRCSKCGYVHRDNRKTQEDFVCLACGYSANADFNASQNIKFFAEIDVLISNLLKQESNGWFVPKTHNKFFIKKTLDDYYEKNCSYEASSDVGVSVNGDFPIFHRNL